MDTYCLLVERLISIRPMSEFYSGEWHISDLQNVMSFCLTLTVMAGGMTVKMIMVHGRIHTSLVSKGLKGGMQGQRQGATISAWQTSDFSPKSNGRADWGQRQGRGWHCHSCSPFKGRACAAFVDNVVLDASSFMAWFAINCHLMLLMIMIVTWIECLMLENMRCS